VNQLPEGHALLPVIADRLASVGLCEQAVKAYIKVNLPIFPATWKMIIFVIMQCGCIRLAVDTCVELQQWSQAVSLAEQHQVEDIEGLLAQYAEYLLNKGDLSRAVELYKKAGRTLEAIKIMINVRSFDSNFKLIF
jgi:WD repeat-containing protein 35